MYEESDNEPLLEEANLRGYSVAAFVVGVIQRRGSGCTLLFKSYIHLYSDHFTTVWFFIVGRGGDLYCF